MTTISSTDLNIMIYRYLLESGFLHSAYTFGLEAAIDKETSIDVASVQPEALVIFVQKGIQYLEMEANLEMNPDADEAVDFSFIKPLDLLKKNVDELKTLAQDHKRKAAEELQKQSKGKGKVHCEMQLDKVNHKLKETVTVGGPKPVDNSTSAKPLSHGAHSSDLLILEGHSAEVCDCAWSPTALVLASGSGDSTSRIWNIADRTNSKSLKNRIAKVRVLKHNPQAKPNEKGKVVNTIDWNSDGTRLATGSDDGVARIWNLNGELMSVLSEHTGPVFSIKWNKKGDHLLTGSSDQSVILWDVNAKEYKQKFKFHSGPVLDIDWRTNHVFASGSSDRRIYIYARLDKTNQSKCFLGIWSDEVNCVKWDPTGLLLASCSDDTTTKVWSLKQDAPLHDFKGHVKEVYTIRWRPGEFTANKLLASASYDSTVKLWDVERGSLFHSLNGHRDAVYCISFSPNGEYLASGSRDKSVNIWSVKDGKLMKTYGGNGSISQVSWTKDGDKIAYSTSGSSVFVSDIRM